MDKNSILPVHFNLTGQVEIQGYIPDFRGNYSCVYRGLLRGNFVAVKIIQSTGEPESMKRKVRREIFVWGSARHQNIHAFYEFADDPAFGPFGALISPWSAKGDAGRFLKENGERMIVSERMNLWKGVTEGVIYLHDQHPPIVHGDLKPGNVLIDDFVVAKICDFGLARIFLEEGSSGMTTTSEHTGTARYLAPELVASDTTVYPTLTSDVYALGCLGLEFICLQQPFSNHVNNNRGQIFRNLRRGLPPAVGPPQRDWPSLRAWPILVKCWNVDPHSRPSAFAASHLLGHTDFTFPLVIVQRIVHFVDTEFNGKTHTQRVDWERRCRCLRNLCLMSRAYRKCTIPFLYREIRLDLQRQPQHLTELISTLESTATKALLSPQEPNSYGTCTKSLFISIAGRGPYPSHFSVGIHSLVNKLPALQPMYLQSERKVRRVMEVPFLKTLTFWHLDLTILFDHTATIQALECVQRLSINTCYDSALFTRLLQEPFPKVYLPNLHELSLQAFASFNSFSIISNWEMPALISLRYVYLSVAFPFTALFPLLQTHGPQLQHLTLRCHSLSHQDSIDLLNMCGGLRSLNVEGEVSFCGVFSSHLRLEEIIVDSTLLLPSMSASAMEIVLEPFMSLRVNSQTSFPNLVAAEINLKTGNHFQYRHGQVSFHAGDKFICCWDGRNTYRLYDPPARSATVSGDRSQLVAINVDN